MRRDLPLERIIAQTRLYVVADARDREAPQRWSLKPEHDVLYQYVLDQGLARWVTVAIGKYQRPSQTLLDFVENRVKRVQWWAGNAGTRPPPDVLLIRTDSLANSWAQIRTAAEAESRNVAIWQDDPALFTRLPTGEFVCRTACVGHEGTVFYLAYDHETEWTATLERSGFRLNCQGRDAYLGIVRTPGLVAESESRS